jgi:DNA excision repair protein ERCC-1
MEGRIRIPAIEEVEELFQRPRAPMFVPRGLPQPNAAAPPHSPQNSPPPSPPLMSPVATPPQVEAILPEPVVKEQLPSTKPKGNASTTRLNALMINAKQRENRLLKYIRNVPCDFGESTFDFRVAVHVGVFFLSLSFHRQYPDYLRSRAAEARSVVDRRILLVLVDEAIGLEQLSVEAIELELVLVLAWSNAEAARYLETFKSYETKPADEIRERVEDNWDAQLSSVLTSVRGVNKTDVRVLLSHFGVIVNRFSCVSAYNSRVSAQSLKRAWNSFRCAKVSGRRR